MYKVGIIGHSPDNFINQELSIKSVEDTIDLIHHQYGKVNYTTNIEGQPESLNNGLTINIPGEIGTGLWAGQVCFSKHIKYHLFLPFLLEMTSESWYEKQKQQLYILYGAANSVSVQSIIFDKTLLEFAYLPIIDDSNFTVAFWEGRRQGRTYNAIKYALKNNKVVLNGTQNLRLIINRDI